MNLLKLLILKWKRANQNRRHYTFSRDNSVYNSQDYGSQIDLGTSSSFIDGEYSGQRSSDDHQFGGFDGGNGGGGGATGSWDDNDGSGGWDSPDSDSSSDCSSDGGDSGSD